MERKVRFADYQEQTADDHNNLQEYAQTSLDHLVNDVVTKSRRYSGLTVIKTATAEVRVDPGRFYDADGAIFNRDSQFTQSMVSHTAGGSRKIVTVSVSASTVLTDETERDILVDVENEITEPQSVSMTEARSAVLTFTPGSESTDPQPPLIPVTHIAVAHILMDTTQVVSVTMLTDNRVESTENLNSRAKVLETWKGQMEPRVNGIASDLAALQNRISQLGQQSEVTQLYRDMALVKEALEIPDTASDYAADRFLNDDESDTANALALGYDAKVQEGIRFADANVDEFELDIFSANDPNAKVTNGLLLPAYDEVAKIAVEGPFHSDLGIAQYGFQTFDLVQLSMSRQRTRYGALFSVCSNSAWWNSGKYDKTTGTFKRAGETFEVVAYERDAGNPSHALIRVRQMWVDSYKDPYWSFLKTDHTIEGAQIAQTFLVANDTWATSIEFWMTTKAANENVFVTLCEINNGVPDLERVISHVTVAHASLLEKAWTKVPITPTFLRSGRRYAIVLVSNANHKFGMVQGQAYIDGTFFYSTDGAYFQGDLTKDLMFKVNGARFIAPQVTVDLEQWNLDGGMRSVDILADMVVPASTELIFEVRPSGGSGEWLPLTGDNLGALASAPAGSQARIRFVGTRDVMPGIKLTGSTCTLSRPKTTLKHVSTTRTLGAASVEIYVELLLEEFDDHIAGTPTQPHDVDCSIVIDPEGTPSVVAPDSATDTIIAQVGNVKWVKRLYAFTPVSSTEYAIVVEGQTNSAGSTFHVAQRIDWAV